MKTVVSYSGGKDSTAMLLRLLELDEQVDDIVFADTGFEFPELYDYLDRIEKHIGRKVTRIKYTEKEFKEWMYGKVTRGKHKGLVRGFPLTGFPCWLTREAKIRPLTKLQKDFDIVCVGIASDEAHRCSKEQGKIRYPLVEWGWSEQDCVNYLNEKKLLNPLYKNFNRLGCWFCPKQNDNSLYTLWKMYPKLWRELKKLNAENKKVRGDPIFLDDLDKYEEEFKNYKPKKLPKYQCYGCEAVKSAFLEHQCDLNVFSSMCPDKRIQVSKADCTVPKALVSGNEVRG